MADQSKKTIMVVDDDSRMERFVKMNLDLEGSLTLEANNGLQALEKVRDFNPDLVLLDVEMPGMDGFETLKRIREISARSSGRSMESRIEALERYVTGWLNNFGHGHSDAELVELDRWLRRRVRLCYWKQWKR